VAKLSAATGFSTKITRFTKNPNNFFSSAGLSPVEVATDTDTGTGVEKNLWLHTMCSVHNRCTE